MCTFIVSNENLCFRSLTSYLVLGLDFFLLMKINLHFMKENLLFLLLCDFGTTLAFHSKN